MTDHKGYEQLDPNIFPAHVLYAPPRVWRSNDSCDDPMTLFFLIKIQVMWCHVNDGSEVSHENT